MALIYAFRDEAGDWHGNPNARTSTPPREYELLMDASQQDADPAGPFFGQRLTVMAAGMEGPEGNGRYTTASGRRFYTHDCVDKALGNDDYIRQRRSAGDDDEDDDELE